MIDITAFIMGTCHPTRLAWLETSVDHLDAQNFPFVKKILAIDQFGGHTFPENLIDKFIAAGWTLQIDSHRSRILSTAKVLEQIKSEYVFYNEDDVLATLPKIEDLETVFNTTLDGKLCGMISMALGGTQFDAASHFLGDLAFIDENAILTNQEYIFFRRLERFKSEYFFEFPGLCTRTKLFKDVHEAALAYRGTQIERGLTLAWFGQGYNYKYYKASVAKADALETLLVEPARINTHCRFLENLDENQGSFSLGGWQHY